MWSVAQRFPTLALDIEVLLVVTLVCLPVSLSVSAVI